METLLSVLPLITKNQWFGSWDVRKGYFNVAVHPDQQRFFCFDFENERYMFTCLVMGASVAPRLFSKLMGVLVQVARTCGIDVSFYLDDTLVRGDSRDETNFNLRLFGALLQMAGFLLHEGKSVADAVQRIQYLGFIIDSRDLSITLPPERESALRHAVNEARRFLRSGRQTTLRQAARVIGLIVAASPATEYGKGHYRSLERAKTDALIDAHADFSAPFVWPESTAQELDWWAQLPSPITTCFAAREFTEELTTDASLEGWGAIWRERRVFGVWEECTVEPIDELEMRAVLAALQTLPILAHGVNILLNCDNTTVVAYINKMGGTVQRLHVLARQVWDLLEEFGAFMHAVYVPSAENPADELTRGFKRSKFLDLEVQLNPVVFESFVHEGPFTPTIDWFASSVNCQLPRFCSWLPSSSATFTDAFSQFWGNEPGYMFPPFSLLPRILAKVRRDHANVLLVHPNWPGALWFPLLTSKSSRLQFLFLIFRDYLRYDLTFRDHTYAKATGQVCRSSTVPGSSQPSPPDARSLARCVMDFWQVGDAAVWKTIFASHAPSTTNSYTGVFAKFVCFLHEGGLSVRSAQIHHLLQFLQLAVDAKKAASTQRTYLAATSFFLKLFDRNDLVEHPLLKFFAAGTQRLAPLPKSRVSVWDPAIPMSLIRSKPVPSSFLLASKEALFLLLLATGLRVDDVSKLSFECELDDSSSPQRLIIPFMDRRKCKVNGAYTTSITLKEYESDERLCPARAVLRMLDLSADVRVSGVKSLFVSSTGWTPVLFTLRGWVVDILREAGITATPGSCRSASTSRAFADGVPLDEILNAAGWSSQNTFFRFYQREVKRSGSVRAVNLMPTL
jgi:integrase